ncbi:hypothetical protein ACXPVS_06555 [Pseudomonas sp. Ma2-10]
MAEITAQYHFDVVVKTAGAATRDGLDAPPMFAVDGVGQWWERMQVLPSFKATQPQ